jgi:hypothetical protein
MQRRVGRGPLERPSEASVGATVKTAMADGKDEDENGEVP